MTTEKKWEDMTGDEKREERFKVWLNPTDVKFDSPEAKSLYQGRVNRFIKAIKMEEPDRVPVYLPSGTFPAYYSGHTFRTIMYDYQAMKDAWVKFMDDFGDMDTYQGPGLVPCGRIAEMMESKITALPGLGLPETAGMNQVIEGEYMLADEYDAYMMDPTDYHLRTMMPRTSGLFESFKNLPQLRHGEGNLWVGLMSDPEIRKTFQTLMTMTEENEKHMAVNQQINDLIHGRGYPPFMGFYLMTGAPFDHFADLLRGTKGIVLDMFRQPKKLHQALEFQLEMTLKNIKNFRMTDCPICCMPLHKGDDMFMSDKQFDEFYWPGLKAIFLAMIDEGLVPMPFAEGKYTRRLKQIADMPRSGVAWWFDQTDMAEAKKILGDTSCIMGNVPTSVMMTGTPEQVKENCKRLIDDCGSGGGYILAGGATINRGDIRNLKAMMEAANEYGQY